MHVSHLYDFIRFTFNPLFKKKKSIQKQHTLIHPPTHLQMPSKCKQMNKVKRIWADLHSNDCSSVFFFYFVVCNVWFFQKSFRFIYTVSYNILNHFCAMYVGLLYDCLCRSDIVVLLLAKLGLFEFDFEYFKNPFYCLESKMFVRNTINGNHST